MIHFLKFLSIAISLTLSACTLNPSKPNDPVVKPVTPVVKTREPIIALALGGGGAKGFAHIGAIKILELHGIKPRIVTGTSAGSFVGSLYASGKTPYQLQVIAEKFEEKDIRDLTLSTEGFLDGGKLQDYVNQLLGNKAIQDLPIKFAAVATRLEDGNRAVFTRGNTGQAVRASCSIPNIFVPATIGGKRYVDGGLVSPIPVSAARDLGADIVIAIDISSRPKEDIKMGLFGLLDQTLNIMSQQNIQAELAQADVVIKPAVKQFGTLDITKKHEAILEGERSAQLMISNIEQAIAKFKASPAARKPAPKPKFN